MTKRVAEATPEQLEWQLRPGMNTIGMLLAHLAVVEVYWVEVVGRGIESDAEVDRIVQGILGIRMEDGMPLPEEGTHPRSLAGKTAADYLEMLRRARSATHRALRSWDDHGLAETRMVDGREVSLDWLLLYHLVEHFASTSGRSPNSPASAAGFRVAEAPRHCLVPFLTRRAKRPTLSA